MKKSLFTLLACACLFLMGCPLKTDSAISGEAVTIPAALPGKWVIYKDGKPGTSSYQVKADAANRSKFSILTIDQKGNIDTEGGRTAQLSRVKGQLFLSVYEKGDELDEAGYYHYAFNQISNSEIHLIPLKENIVSTETSGKDLAAYISSHSKSEYLDEAKTEQYRRQD